TTPHPNPLPTKRGERGRTVMATLIFAPPIEQALAKPAAGVWSRALRHRGFVVGAVILLLMIVIAIGAPVLAPHDPFDQSLARRLRPPAWSAAGSWIYPLGTDSFGRDYLSRLMYGARLALLVGLGSALLAGLIGSVLGVIAGYFRGRVDRLVSLI